MSVLQWDKTGERRYETGVDRGVLYIPTAGVYDKGYAWNGLTGVTESPSGAESNKQYADNSVYVNLLSSEEFGATVEAFTYPDEFGQCDGTASPEVGVSIGQQSRATFGLSYRTKIGTDTDSDKGYKLHLVYGALAAPSERAYASVNDSPEAITLSWEVSTTPVAVGTIDGVVYKPTATLTVDSTKVDATALALLEAFLYGTEGTDPSLPLPAAVIALFETTTLVTPTAPSYNASTHVITVPVVTGVTYYDGTTIATGTITLTTGQKKVITARTNAGYVFPDVTDDDWLFTF